MAAFPLVSIVDEQELCYIRRVQTIGGALKHTHTHGCYRKAANKASSRVTIYVINKNGGKHQENWPENFALKSVKCAM